MLYDSYVGLLSFLPPVSISPSPHFSPSSSREDIGFPVRAMSVDVVTGEFNFAWNRLHYVWSVFACVQAHTSGTEDV